MKRVGIGIVLAGLLALGGCNPGGTGGNTLGGAKFTLRAPRDTSKGLHGGEPIKVHIRIVRGQDFSEDIELSAPVEPKDKGVTATIAPATLKASEEQQTAQLTVSVGELAEAGLYRVIVTGKSATGGTADVTVKVEVPEKK
jgi:hypothetical protein